MAINDFIISALNLNSDQIDSIDVSRIDSALTATLKLKDVRSDCPFCGGTVRIHGYSVKNIRTLDSAGLKTTIRWKRRRYLCKDCGQTFSEENVFSPGRLKASYSLISQIVKDLHNVRLSIEEIAARAHVSPTTVQHYADSFLIVPRQYLPVYLGIDELSTSMAKYGSAYVCVFVDNQNRCLCEILPSRSKHELSKYFEKIPLEERKRVLFVTIDMWEPYKDVASKYLPEARIAVDPFHVIKHLSDSFSRLRIHIMNNVPMESAEYYLLKHWNKLLEKDYNLDNEPQYNSYFHQKMNYRDLYDLLLKIDPHLTKAYQLKEIYRQFNKTATEENAAEQLDQMIQVFTAADLSCYSDFVSMITTWHDEIVNSFARPYDDRKQSNALAENMNGQIRVLLHVSNGMSNFERFRARALYALNGRIVHTITQKLSSQKRSGKPRGSYKKH